MTNSTSLEGIVNFGLLPLCYGVVEGLVTDAATGSPVVGAQVYVSEHTAKTDSAGRYSIGKLRLSEDNRPERYSLQGRQDEYWTAYSDVFYAVCGSTTEVNLQLLRQAPATLSGTVTDTDTKPLAAVALRIGDYVFQSDALGKFKTKPLLVGNNNTEAAYWLFGHKDGYWDVQVQATGYPNSNTVVGIVMVPICGGITVNGKVVFADSQLPAVGVPVVLQGQNQSGSVTSDAQGNYTFTGQTLNPPDNSPASVRVFASAPGYYSVAVERTLPECEKGFDMPPALLQPIPPVPKDNFAGVTGRVYDLDTGAPIPSVQITGLGPGPASTDAEGRYTVASINLGTVLSNYYNMAIQLTLVACKLPQPVGCLRANWLPAVASQESSA